MELTSPQTAEEKKLVNLKVLIEIIQNKTERKDQTKTKRELLEFPQNGGKIFEEIMTKNFQN